MTGVQTCALPILFGQAALALFAWLVLLLTLSVAARIVCRAYFEERKRWLDFELAKIKAAKQSAPDLRTFDDKGLQ